MRTIVFDEIGTPKDDFANLRISNIPIPEIGDNEVLVKMTGASINPGDFLFIQGLYPEPKKPVFPGQIAGNHGVGIIEKVGKNVKYKIGTLVHFNYFNTWADYVALPSEWVIPLPADYPIEKASQFSNIITAWDLIDRSKVQPGQWLAITAGNSTLATMVSQLASQRGIKVISIVRNTYGHLNLKKLGVDQVIELNSISTNISEKISDITNNAGIHGVIDCVGGPLVGDLIRSLALGGQVVLYGGFSESTFELHNFDILMRDVTIAAYAYRYFFTPPKEEHMEQLSKIAEASKGPEFQIQIGGFHPLEEYKTAIYESINHPENGKRFFKM